MPFVGCREDRKLSLSGLVPLSFVIVRPPQCASTRFAGFPRVPKAPAVGPWMWAASSRGSHKSHQAPSTCHLPDNQTPNTQIVEKRNELEKAIAHESTHQEMELFPETVS